MKTKLRLLLLLLALCLTGCRSNDGGKNGAWDDHARLAIQVGQAGLERNGIEVHSPVRIPTTHFAQADGIINGIWPYVNQPGGKVGGWWTGSCRGNGNATIAKAGNLWNRNTGTHEACHQLEAYAKCERGHPAYMRKYAGAPDWPYFTGSFAAFAGLAAPVSTTNVYVEDEEGNKACVTYYDDTAGSDLKSLQAPEKEDLTEAREAFARSLLPVKDKK